MHATCGPTALSSSAAVTDESTPPDRPQMTRSVADALPQFRHGLLEERADLPQALAAADVVEEIVQDAAAVRRVADLGMELQAVDRPAAMPDGGDRAGVGRGQRRRNRR